MAVVDIPVHCGRARGPSGWTMESSLWDRIVTDMRAAWNRALGCSHCSGASTRSTSFNTHTNLSTAKCQPFYGWGALARGYYSWSVMESGVSTSGDESCAHKKSQCCQGLDLLSRTQLCLPSQTEDALEGTWGLNAPHSATQVPSCRSCPLQSNLQSRDWNIWDYQLILWGMDFLRSAGIATHSSIPSWRISWTEESGRLWFMGSQRVRLDWSDLACTHADFLARIFCLAVLDIINFKMCFFNFGDIYRRNISGWAFSWTVVSISLCFLGTLLPKVSMYKQPFCSRCCVRFLRFRGFRDLSLSGKWQSRENQVTGYVVHTLCWDCL